MSSITISGTARLCARCPRRPALQADPVLRGSGLPERGVGPSLEVETDLRLEGARSQILVGGIMAMFIWMAAWTVRVHRTLVAGLKQSLKFGARAISSESKSVADYRRVG